MSLLLESKRCDKCSFVFMFSVTMKKNVDKDNKPVCPTCKMQEAKEKEKKDEA